MPILFNEIQIIWSLLGLVIAVLFHLYVPGFFLIRRFLSGKVDSTAANCFFLGLIWMMSLAVVFVLYSDDVRTLNSLIKITTAALILYGLFFSIKDSYSFQLGKNFSQYKGRLCIPLVGTLFVALYVLSHNIGFDDVAHINYLSQVQREGVFPIYREVVGYWQAARYPFFGILHGVVGYNIPGGELLSYYFLGLAIFFNVLLRSYDFFIEDNKTSSKTAIAGLFLIMALLSFVGVSSYFNSGLFPVEQSRLLFMTALIYGVVGWFKYRNPYYILFMSGLMVVSVLMHLNMLLLYMVVLPVAMMLVVFLRIKKITILKVWLVFLFFMFLSVPAVLNKSHGILQYVKPVVEETGGGDEIAPPEPSLIEVVWDKVISLGRWVKDGRYKNKYTKRAFTPEMVMVPIVLLFFSVVGNLLMSLVLIGSVVFILAKFIVVFPQQVVLSVFKSSPLFILYDLARSEYSRQYQNLFSDSYTALMLNAVYSHRDIGNAKNSRIKSTNISEEFATVLYAPEVPQLYKNCITRNQQYTVNGFIFNSRFWGEASHTDYGEKITQQYKEIDSKLEKLLLHNQYKVIPSLLKASANHAINLLSRPTRTTPYPVEQWHQLSKRCFDSFVFPENKNTLLYKGGAMVRFDNVKSGDKFMIEYYETAGSSLGFIAALKPLYGSELVFERARRQPHGGVKVHLSVKGDIDENIVLFSREQGHYSGINYWNKFDFEKK